MEIKYGPNFDKSMHRLFSNNPIYAIPRFFNDTRYAIKYAWQRVFRGWDDRWHWEFCGMFPDLIIDVCDSIIKNGMGYPAKFKNERQWHAVLKRIKKGFEEYNKLENELVDLSEQKKITRKLNKSFDLLKENYESMWD